MTEEPEVAPTGRRLTIVIGVVLVVGFLAANTISFFSSRDQLRDAVLNTELPLISDNIYSVIQADLLRPIFVASLMANDTFLQDWIINGEENVDRITRYLKTFRDKYDVFTSFLISEPTRNYYHFSGLARVVTDPQKDEWYFRVRAMQKPYEINVDTNEQQENALTVFINHRVLDHDGKFIGVTGVGLNFDTVAETISRYEKEFGRGLYFADKLGRIKIRSKAAAVREDDITSAPGIGSVAKRILSAEQGTFTYERGGETYFLSSRFIPELEWYIIVEQRESDRAQAIRQSLLTSTVIGLLITAVIIGIVAGAVRLFERRLEYLATVDKLTGIGNRRVFDLYLDQAIRSMVREKSPFSIIIFDIDHFKRVNDTLGHIAGDAVIRDIARTIEDHIRESDVLCRWGGEEFSVLAFKCEHGEALRLAEKVRAAVEVHTFPDLPGNVTVTISGGVAEAHAGVTHDTILGRADQALYRAKAEGRNRVLAA